MRIEEQQDVSNKFVDSECTFQRVDMKFLENTHMLDVFYNNENNCNVCLLLKFLICLLDF